MKDSLTKLYGSHLINLDMLPDDAVIIDAGACVGKVIDDIASRIKFPFLYLLEPHVGNLETLYQKHNGRYNIYEAALVGEKEPREMLFYKKDGLIEWGNVTNFYATKKGETYNVRTISLSRLLSSISINTIDYLKMDIEGCEWDVVYDMTKEMAKRIKQISIEIHSHAAEIIYKLEWLGYEVRYYPAANYNNGQLYAVKKEL